MQNFAAGTFDVLWHDWQQSEREILWTIYDSFKAYRGTIIITLKSSFFFFALVEHPPIKSVPGLS